ncbi:peptide deformylase [Alkalispirillum mobile]|uniref:Peptide deformylase n=1 Tax=Alkalispirillum mobile TaxID=85925 RepID=A0A498BT55_9GAMM|nr:peptide deformylase [Alkalispirillum mobile]RLK47154.1 peptide deformylase [Alkalispirillum mobile]
MAILDILVYPDPRLREVAQPVEQVDDDIRYLADDMLETMYDAKGIGLAATQVGVNQRVVVMDLVDEGEPEPLVLINPEILSREGAAMGQEGCLSIPGFYEDVERAERIRFRALDRDGEPFEQEAEGLMAVCVQHEIDHLDGKLFVDYLSELKRKRIRRKLEKLVRQGRVGASGQKGRA